MTHSDPHALVGAYAVNALDAEEARAFAAHLDGCLSCQAELAHLREAAAELSVLSAAPPPPELRASVLAQLDRVEELPDESPKPATKPAPRRWRRYFALAAAIVLLVGAGAVAVTAWQRADQLAQASQSQAELLSAPDVRIVRTGDGGSFQVTYAVSAALDRGMVISTSLPELPDGRVYQLWLSSDSDLTEVRPSVAFTGGPSVAENFTGVRDTVALAITIESGPGARTPDRATVQAGTQI